MYIVLEGLYCFHINSKLDWDCLQPPVTKAYQNVAQLNLLLEYVAQLNLLLEYVAQLNLLLEYVAQLNLLLEYVAADN